MIKRLLAGFPLALLAFSLLAGCSVRQGLADARAVRAPDPQAIEEVRSGKRIVADVAWWGFDPDDATRSLQAAIDSGAPTVVVPYMGRPWIVTPIKLRSDLELVFQPGVLVLAKKGAFKGRHDSLFTAVNAVDVTLRGYGATLRMRKKDYQSEAYEKAEWRMVLNFRGCRRIRVEGLRLESSGGDGIYLGTGTLPYCADVVIRDVVCHDNHRQGISVISAVNLLIENCVLSGTEGTIPQAGIDFEPDGLKDKLVNCLVRHCITQGNAGAGIMVSCRGLSAKSDPVSVCIENCYLRDGKDGGIDIAVCKDDGPQGLIEFRHCTIENTQSCGLAVYNKSADNVRVRFVDCKWKDVALLARKSGEYDPKAQVPMVFFLSRPEFTKRIGGVEFVNCCLYNQFDRPIIFADDEGTGLGVHDIHGDITVRSPYPARMDLKCKLFNVDLKLIEARE